MDSKLQIISGVFRGRKLRLPPDARPTQNRARIALFNMLESGIINGTNELFVWDAFAGSGAFGIECLSRYTDAKAIFTDVSATSIKTVRDNLGTLMIGSRASAVQTDAIAVVPRYATNANLIFVDAPYSMHELGKVFVDKLSKTVKIGTIVIWEQEIGHEYEPDEKKWDSVRDKRYGRARFLILRKV